MKNYKKIILLSIIVSTAIMSCEKENLNNIGSAETPSVESNKNQIQQKSGVSWSINYGDLEDELVAIVNNTTGDFDDDLIIIQKNLVNETYDFEVEVGASSSMPLPSPEKIVCEGNGYSFASCVRDHLDEHGGCVIIRGNSDDGYTADDDC
jgi:hypothetical protein